MRFIPFRRAAQQSQVTTPVGVFESRRGWKSLNPRYISALAEKFSSVEDAVAFARLCETSGILQNNIRRLSELATTGPEFAIKSTASTLTSYGNTLGSEGKLDVAIEAFKYAIALNRNHVPAHLALSTAHREKRQFDRALQVLRSAPSKDTIGTETLDFTFDVAFHEVGVLIAKQRVQKSERDLQALVLKLREAQVLGQKPVSKTMIDSGSMTGEDPIADRREKMRLIEGLLEEYTQ